MKLTFSTKRVILFFLFTILPLLLATWERKTEQQFFDARKSMVRTELQDYLQLLRDRDDPETLLSEALFECLADVEQLDFNSVATIEKRLKETFSKIPSFSLFDENLTLLKAGGFEKETLNELRSILFFIRGEEEKIASFSWNDSVRAGRASDKLFEGTYRRYNSLNHIFQRTVSFFGKRGLLIIGSFYPRNFQSYLFRDHFTHSAIELEKGSANGSLVLFQPFETLDDVAWLKGRFNRGVPGYTQRVFLTGVHSDSVPEGILPETWEKIKLGLTSDSVGFVEDQETGVGFVRLDALDDSVVAICPRTWGKRNQDWYKLFFILWSGGLLILGFVLFCDAERVTPGSLGAKGVVLLLLAGFLPVVGLLWSFWSLHEWNGLISTAQRYVQLDQRLTQYEKRHEQTLGKAIIGIQRFIEDPLWTKPDISADQITSLTLALNRPMDFSKQMPIKPFIVHRDQGSLYAGSRALQTEGRGYGLKVLELVDNLIIAFQETFNRASGGKIPSPGNMKASVFLDGLQSLMGAENLYRMVLKIDCLVGHRMIGETIWSYLHLLRDQNQQVLLTFFFTLERKLIQRWQIFNWTKELSKSAIDEHGVGGIPEVVFGSGQSNDFILVPDFVSRHSVLRQILIRRTMEGGMQRFRISFDGREYLALARPLRGLDYIGFAFLPIEERETASWRTLALWAIIYPFLLISTIWVLLRLFFLTPVKGLTKGVERIAAGDYDVRLPALSDDELGDLCLSFNQMAHGLKEKEYMSRFLSDLTLEAVKTGERPLATRIRASVMFSDIRDFTTLSEGKPGEEIVEMLNDYLTDMERVIERNGGSIDKFIGDAIMAVFIPVHGLPDPALRAMEAAIEMRSALEEFNTKRKESKVFTIKTGIGIASGEVLMGTLGGAGRQDFTVTGKTVNRAAAMEKLSKKAKISFVVVCEETMQRLPASWEKEQVSGDPEPGKSAESGWEIVSQPVRPSGRGRGQSRH